MKVDPKSFEKIDTPYSEIPWHRKRWFVTTLFLIFIPACLVIALTGDLYAQIKGDTYKYTEKQKKTVILMAVLFLVFGLFRMFISK